MRISDWSSDVCSSDLREQADRIRDARERQAREKQVRERQAPRVVGGNLQRNRTDDRRDNEHRDRTPRVVGGDLQRNRVNDRRDDERRARQRIDERSEEHTSELQSLMRLSYAVFCLKKKNKTTHRQLFDN